MGDVEFATFGKLWWGHARSWFGSWFRWWWDTRGNVVTNPLKTLLVLLRHEVEYRARLGREWCFSQKISPLYDSIVREGRALSCLKRTSSADSALRFHSSWDWGVSRSLPLEEPARFSLFASDSQTRLGFGFHPEGTSGSGNLSLSQNLSRIKVSRPYHLSSAIGWSERTKPFSTGRPSRNV